MKLCRFGIDKLVIKSLVLLLIHRTVEVIVLAASVISRLSEGTGFINTLIRNDRSRRIKKAERTAAKLLDFFGKSIGSKRTCGNDNVALWNIRNLTALKLDERMRLYFFGYHTGKFITVNSECTACRNAAFFCTFNADRTESFHFGFEQSCRRADTLSLERVGADKLCEHICFVCGRMFLRLHLGYCHGNASVCERPCRFNACQASAHNKNSVHLLIFLFPAFSFCLALIAAVLVKANYQSASALKERLAAFRAGFIGRLIPCHKVALGPV